jgi:hypothetical protein
MPLYLFDAEHLLLYAIISRHITYCISVLSNIVETGELQQPRWEEANK